MKKKESISRKLYMVFNTAVLALASFLCLYPMVYVIFASFSDSTMLLKHTGIIWKPMGFNLKAYEAVAENPMIVTGYINSVIVLVSGTFLSVLMTALGAHFLTRKNVGAKKFISWLFLFPMFFSGGMIPTYLLVKNLGMLNTLISLFIPALVNTYNMIIMRTSFAGIPESLEEAAVIDGANDLEIFARVILPLSKAIIAVMVLYYGVGYWNSWFNAMIYLNDRNKYPLQLVLREILIQNDTDSLSGGSIGGDVFAIGEYIKYAVIVAATVPILCIYPFLQKYFVKGVMIGAVKG